MQKQYLILLILSISSFAQTKGTVFYGEFNCIQCGPKNGKQYIGRLIFDNKESYYHENDTLARQLKTAIDNKKVYTNSNQNGGVFYPSENSDDLDDFSHYQVHTSKDSVHGYFIYSSPTLGDVHYVKEKKEKINWQLSKEEKKIGKFTCLKATGKFRGRIYTAWYTLDIPLPYGPWKLQGLPGLILEAYNENQEIYFYAKKIEYPVKDFQKIPQVVLPNGFKWHTFKESLTIMEIVLKEAYEKGVLIAQEFKGVRVIRQEVKDVFNEFEE